MREAPRLPFGILILALLMLRAVAFSYQRAEKGVDFDTDDAYDSDSSKMKPGLPVDPIPRMNFAANPLLSWMRPKARVWYQPRRHPENSQIVTGRPIETSESSQVNKSNLHPAMSTSLEAGSLIESVEGEKRIVSKRENSSNTADLQEASYIHSHYEDEDEHYHPSHVYHDEDSESHEEIYPAHEESHPYHPPHYEVAEPVVLVETVPLEPQYVFVQEKHIHHVHY